MNTKHIAAAAVGAVIIAGGAFWAGTSYASAGRAPGPFGAGQGNLQFTGGAGKSGQAMRTLGGATAGQIIASQDGTLTVQMADGSTKLVLVSGSTQVMKSTVGSLADLASGTEVSVTGTPNSDGSITAQSVQIRPAGLPIQKRTGGN